MSTLATFTSPDNVTYEFEDSWSREQINQKADVYYVEGLATDTAGDWTGTCDGITSYYEGLTVIYSPAVAGSSTTTLNINNIGAVTCYTTGNIALTTHYDIGSSIMFTYHDNGWRRADYNTNTDTNVRQRLRSSQNENRPLLMSYCLNNEVINDVDNLAYRNNDIYANPSTGTITAQNFVGKNNGFTLGQDVPATAELTDTKNTAGAANTSSKIYLIGATAQSTNPVTYSHDTAYVGTDGCLYSEGIKVLTAHQDISGKADLASPTFTGVPAAPTANPGTNTTQIATTAFVMDSFRANDAMLFKGTIGMDGTVSVLPDTHETGWNYRVITAGTYAGKVCNVGDMIICVISGDEANDDHWTVVQSNLDGTVVGPPSSVNNHVVVFNGSSGISIKDSGYTIFDAVYPVGSIYMSVVSTSPADLFGGTWEALGGRFLIGANSSYSAGATGGAASQSYTPAGTVGNHTLTTTEIPSHSHGLNSHKHSVGAHAHGLNSHKHSVGAHSHGLNSHKHSVGAHSHGLNSHKHSVGAHSHGLNNHTHSTPAHSHAIGNGASHGFASFDTGKDIYGTNTAFVARGTAGSTYFASYSNSTKSDGSGTSGKASGSTANSSAFDTGAASGSTANSTAFDTGAASGSTANSTAFESGAASGNTANSTAFDTGAASGNTAATGSGGAHNHGFTGTAATLNTMPPYLSVYMWKRTA